MTDWFVRKAISLSHNVKRRQRRTYHYSNCTVKPPGDSPHRRQRHKHQLEMEAPTAGAREETQPLDDAWPSAFDRTPSPPPLPETEVGKLLEEREPVLLGGHCVACPPRPQHAHLPAVLPLSHPTSGVLPPGFEDEAVVPPGFEDEAVVPPGFEDEAVVPPGFEDEAVSCGLTVPTRKLLSYIETNYASLVRASVLGARNAADCCFGC